MRVNEHPEDKMQRIRGRVWYWDILRVRVRRYMMGSSEEVHVYCIHVLAYWDIGGSSEEEPWRW